jgi:hypothetical protein
MCGNFVMSLNGEEVTCTCSSSCCRRILSEVSASSRSDARVAALCSSDNATDNSDNCNMERATMWKSCAHTAGYHCLGDHKTQY